MQPVKNVERRPNNGTNGQSYFNNSLGSPAATSSMSPGYRSRTLPQNTQPSPAGGQFTSIDTQERFSVAAALSGASGRGLLWNNILSLTPRQDGGSGRKAFSSRDPNLGTGDIATKAFSAAQVKAQGAGAGHVTEASPSARGHAGRHLNAPMTNDQLARAERRAARKQKMESVFGEVEGVTRQSEAILNRFNQHADDHMAEAMKLRDDALRVERAMEQAVAQEKINNMPPELEQGTEYGVKVYDTMARR
jgi:hypothetical protein